MTPALFLDRDGVINVDHGYVHKPEDCQFVEGIFDMVRQANVKGWLVVVVTNQAGIARGYYDKQDFMAFSDWMKSQFSSHGATIDAIYFCPHHAEHGIGEYLKACHCRKPEPGMFIEAKSTLNIDMGNSVMIGDNLTDLQAASTAGVKRLYLLKSEPTLLKQHHILDQKTTEKFEYFVAAKHAQIQL